MTDKVYLGETRVPTMGTPFHGYGPKEWALFWIACYGMIDGAHHKQWLIDQVAQILCGSPVVLWLARWSDGEKEYRPRINGYSAEYTRWLWTDAHDPECFEWDRGVAP